MHSQCLPDFRLAVDTDGKGKFANVGVLRAVSVTLNLASLGIVTAGAALKDLRSCFKGMVGAKIAGRCVFADENSQNTIKLCFANNIILEWRIDLPQLGTVQGLFQITALDIFHDHQSEPRFDLALLSAGRLSFV